MKKFLIISIAFLTISCGSIAPKGDPNTAQKVEKKEKTASVDTTLNRIVLISTEFGNMKIKLYDATPRHRDNFILLARTGFYDSLLFHRVIKNFMIQGGDPDSRHAPAGVMLGGGDIGYTIPPEFVDTIIHKKGALCAARTDNPEKASSGCQFYIVQGSVLNDEQIKMYEARTGQPMTEQQKAVYKTIGGTPWLDRAYTVYGEVIEGLDVIDKIAAVQTAPGDRPLKDVRMKVSVIK